MEIFRSQSITLSSKQFFLLLDIGEVKVTPDGRFDYKNLLNKIDLDE